VKRAREREEVRGRERRTGPVSPWFDDLVDESEEGVEETQPQREGDQEDDVVFVLHQLSELSF
jgi:hypothetical protein